MPRQYCRLSNSGIAALWLLQAGIAVGQTMVLPPPPDLGSAAGAAPAVPDAYPSIYGNNAASVPQFTPSNQPGPYSIPGPAVPTTPSPVPMYGNVPAAQPGETIVHESPIGSGASPIGSGAAVGAPTAPSDYGGAPISSMPSVTEEIIEPVQSGPAWYQYPWVWFPTDGWNSSIEFGLNGSEGNSNSLSYVAGSDISRITDLYNLTINLDYRRTRANGLVTQDNARGNVDFDRNIGISPMAAFIKSGVEYDQFKAFDARINVNGGVSYAFAKTDEFKFITRFGAGASKEVGAADDNWKPEALFGLETNRQVNDRNRIFAKIDYFPAWEDFSDYRMVTDAGWEILLDDSENFSLKLTATNRYDSTPLGLEPQDIDYAATLLYKF